MISLGMLAPPPGQGQSSAWIQLVPLVFFFVVIYFLLIRPARRRQKQTQLMLEALKPGDKVVTSGGIIGTILAVDRSIVQIRIADKVKVEPGDVFEISAREFGRPLANPLVCTEAPRAKVLALRQHRDSQPRPQCSKQERHSQLYRRRPLLEELRQLL